MSAPADRPPSVDKLARSIADVGLPHPMLVDAARAAIATGAPDSARTNAVATSRQMLRPVINATGTILHTNLGRAPMAWEQPERYTNLELDLTTGQRGSRMATAGALIARACGAEDAIIVNNCAAAVLLGLGGLAEGRDVIVSRSELVEIGGGFRIPDVMARSGANLIEVGTTNRTRVDDFRSAVDDPNNDVAVVLRVHQSNFTIVGFTEAPTTAQLAGLNAPLVADIGSGLLDSRCPWLKGDPPGWLADEPAARQTLDGGAGLVMFSGDKLFGGPQAGIIAGDAELVRKCAAHPFARALRPGSLVLAALQATAIAYLAEDGDAIPFWRMASLTIDQLRKRADAFGVGEIIDVMSTPGGGTLPGVEIPSVGIAVEGDQREALRELDHPIIARVNHGDSSAVETTVLDLRTIHPDDDKVVAGVLRSLLSAI
ncbi:MAG: L-seryl-tRNA(Sec) selenium transferase [Acidimicrobiaceae bacterium]|nr:L-seryl-tRNA(Sec) selenium transferase [Acidimicrobiaceae bacterium]